MLEVVVAGGAAHQEDGGHLDLQGRGEGREVGGKGEGQLGGGCQQHKRHQEGHCMAKGAKPGPVQPRQRTYLPALPHLLLQLVQLLLGAAVRGAASCTHISSQLRAHRLQLVQGRACQRLGCCVAGAAQRVAVGAMPADAVCGAPPRLVHQRAPVCLAVRITPGSEGGWACETGWHGRGTGEADGRHKRWRRQRRQWAWGLTQGTARVPTAGR